MDSNISEIFDNSFKAELLIHPVPTGVVEYEYFPIYAAKPKDITANESVERFIQEKESLSTDVEPNGVVITHLFLNLGTLIIFRDIMFKQKLIFVLTT